MIISTGTECERWKFSDLITGNPGVNTRIFQDNYRPIRWLQISWLLVSPDYLHLWHYHDIDFLFPRKVFKTGYCLRNAPIHFWEYFVSLTSNLCSTLAMGVPWYWAILHHIIIVSSLVYNNVYINIYLDVHICHTEVNISDFNNAPALYIL